MVTGQLHVQTALFLEEGPPLQSAEKTDWASEAVCTPFRGQKYLVPVPKRALTAWSSSSWPSHNTD
jgi:hypothetical protein